MRRVDAETVMPREHVGVHARRVSPVLLWIAAFAVFALATGVLVAHRGRVDKAHVVLVYLLLVLAGSAWGGRCWRGWGRFFLRRRKRICC